MQQKLFLDLARVINKKIIVYAIGGTAMMFLGLKPNTNDIDLVFMDEKDRNLFKETAKSLGYKESNAQVVYGGKPNKPIMISLEDARLDLFLLEVINTRFSESMVARASQIHQFDENLIIKIADIHDIIIMKCATGRAKDEEDIVSILKNANVNWDILISEAENQVSLGNEIAILGLGNVFETLNNKNKAIIPKQVLDRLWSLLNRQVKQVDKKDKRKKKGN